MTKTNADAEGVPQHVEPEHEFAALPLAARNAIAQKEYLVASLRDRIARLEGEKRALTIDNTRLAAVARRQESKVSTDSSDGLWLDAFNNVGTGVIIADGQGGIVRWNAAAELLLGSLSGQQLQAILFDRIQQPDIPRYDPRHLTPPSGTPISTLPFGHGLYRRLQAILEGAPDERVVEEVDLRVDDRTGLLDVLLRLRWMWDAKTGRPWILAELTEVGTLHRDELTGVFRRRVLMNKLKREIDARSNGRRQNGSPLSVLMIDGDRFKQVNDTYGHQAGDQVLREIAKRISRTVRDQDLVVRYGGEEFTVLIEDMGLEDAYRIAERIRVMMAAAKVSVHDGRHAIPMTLSIGVAQYQPGDTAGELLEHADQALYVAKEKGRNRVIAHRSKTAPSR